MNYKEIERIIKQLSLRHCIPKDVVKEIVDSQFRFVKNVMESADREDEESFKTVYIPYVGRFGVKPGRLKYLNKKKDEQRIVTGKQLFP